jgi:CRISPR-associated endonuclease Cas1
MAASKNVPQHSQSHNSIVPRHGVVTLCGYGIQVRVDRGHLVLGDGIGADRRHFRLPRVGHGLKRLVVVGADGYVSLSALRWLSDQGASFSMLERDGKVLATTGPVRPSDARLRRAQALAHSNGTALRVARELIRQKLHGQANIARHELGGPEAADSILQFASELPAAQSIPSLRLLEAQGASAYWSAWRTVPIIYPTKDVSRVPEHWHSFGSRISPLTGSPRLAVNPPNAILNYLYALLEAEARRAASSMGLDPGLGVLHADSSHRDSLAFDLMEPTRPLVDSHVIDAFLRQPLRKEWFFEDRNGNARLMACLTAQLSETALTWARALAPVAEWVAQAIWSKQRKPSSAQAWPTRLTQRRRTEGRGRQFLLPSIGRPQIQRICLSCGATTKRGRHCLKCGKETSGMKLIELAKAGRIVTVGADAQRKRSETQRRHEAAKRDWRNSLGHKSVSQETYDKEIQPCLASGTIASIAITLGVSEPYAADIRSGRRRPHPRHWQALAKLACVSPK